MHTPLQKTSFLKITAIPSTERQAGSIVKLKSAGPRNEKLQFFDSRNVHNLRTANPHEFVLRQLLLKRIQSSTQTMTLLPRVKDDVVVCGLYPIKVLNIQQNNLSRGLYG